MQFSFKKMLPHIIVLVSFIACALLYFNPVLQGKTIFQSDIVHYQGMAKQQKDFKAETGEETYWTNSAFGGMPTYQLGAKYPNNYIKNLCLKYQLTFKDCYIIGFSQGAMMTFEFGKYTNNIFAGCVLLSGRILSFEENEKKNFVNLIQVIN